MSKVDCSKVYIKKSTLCKEGENFDGAFATSFFDVGDIIEIGIVRLLPSDFDGNLSPYVFTWSDDIPNKTWAMASGCATFYNTGTETANVKMIRDFENNSFQLIASKQIKKDEELFHQYKSLKWRKCFLNIREKLNIQ